MRIIYHQPKGLRIKKGTFKHSNGKRYPIFNGLTMESEYENCWWSDTLNRWCEVEQATGGEFGNYNDNIINLKQAIRHIKKHKELKKGTVMRLSSAIRGHYEITIIV